MNVPSTKQPGSAPATSHKQRSVVGAPIIFLADPWQDWKRHYARLRNNQMVNLWSGGRPVALTMCGLLGQAGTDVRHAEDCDGCKRSRASEEKRAITGPSRR